MTLQEIVGKIVEALTPIAEQLEKLAEVIKKAFDKIEEHERLFRRPPKWHSKANSPVMTLSRSRIFHCRNNC